MIATYTSAKRADNRRHGTAKALEAAKLTSFTHCGESGNRFSNVKVNPLPQNENLSLVNQNSSHFVTAEIN